MHVLRGRGGTISDDRRAIRDLRRIPSATGSPAVRVWRPHRQIAFGPRDAAHPDLSTAEARAREAGFRPVIRDAGGRAVAYTGSTIALAYAEPADATNLGVGERYDRAIARLEDGFDALGVETTRGEPPNSFCPGSHSLSVAGGKVAGFAQRVRASVAVVGAVVVVADHEAIREGLAPVYHALGLEFDPDSVGSLALAGIDPDPRTVCRTIEDAFVGDRSTSVERVRET